MKGISSWWLFGAACVAALVVVALAMAVVSTPWDQPQGQRGVGLVFLPSLLLSLALLAAAAVGGVLDGVRFGQASSYGKAFSRFVALPLASAVGVGVDLYASLGAVFHCFEF